MNKTQARNAVTSFAMGNRRAIRMQAVATADGWMSLTQAALIAHDAASVAARLAEYDKALAIAFA